MFKHLLVAAIAFPLLQAAQRAEPTAVPFKAVAL